jgi:uncharacterized lipoprotein YajG
VLKTERKLDHAKYTSGKTKMKKILIIAIAAVAISGCAVQTFHINFSSTVEPTKREMQTFFVGGIGQEQEINAAQICGGADKVAKVDAHISFLDGLLGSLTFGIFTPLSARVYCNG